MDLIFYSIKLWLFYSILALIMNPQCRLEHAMKTRGQIVSEVHFMILCHVRSYFMVVNILKDCYTQGPTPSLEGSVSSLLIKIETLWFCFMILYSKFYPLLNVRLWGKPIPSLSPLSRLHETTWDLSTIIHYRTLPSWHRNQGGQAILI